MNLAVSQATQSIVLSQATGMSFEGFAGGQQPLTQSFTVLNAGQGVLSWQAQAQLIPNPQTPAGKSWLSVVNRIRDFNGGPAGTPLVVSVNQQGLAPGQYYGSVNIVAANAANSPQSVSVFLNVLASQDGSPGIVFSTGGVTFGGALGGAIQQQTVSLFNPGDSAVNFTTTTSTTNGAGWLTVTPAEGSLSVGANSSVLTLGANISQLPAGTQTGTLKVVFDDGTVGLIQVAVVAFSPSGSFAGNGQSQPQATVSCAATSVVPNFVQPQTNATAQVAVAQLVQVKLVDGCNNPVAQSNGGAAQLTFSNGDGALLLNDVGGGVWEGTWTPAHAAQGMSAQVIATAGSPGSKQINGALSIPLAVRQATSNAAALPVAAVNAAAAASAMPNNVAPCSYVAIYGTGMADAGTSSAGTLPLTTSLNNTQVLLGATPLPLAYVSPTQVNGLIPCNLSPNASYQLLVQRGSTQSVPTPVTVVELQPGIYSEDLSGSGQGAIQIAGSTLLAAPVGQGSRPAQRGTDYLAIYGTGLGPVRGSDGEPQPPDGAAAAPPTVYQTTNEVSVTVGGVDAPVVFSGLTPTLAGLYQVNALVPPGAPSGDAIPVIVSVKDPQSGMVVQSNTVTIAVK